MVVAVRTKELGDPGLEIDPAFVVMRVLAMLVNLESVVSVAGVWMLVAMTEPAMIVVVIVVAAPLAAHALISESTR